MTDVGSRLTDVFRRTFGDETIVLRDDMTAEDIQGWDSVTHIILIYAVEEEFGMTFSTDDLEDLGNVGHLHAAILRRMQAPGRRG